MLSVIIPVFRARPYIEAAIASVIAQFPSNADVEILVVDNHCDDGSTSVAMDMLTVAGLDCRLLNEPVPGPGKARNCGLKHARGEWIQFFDADDVLYPGKIAAHLDAAARVGSSVAFLYSGWCRGRSSSDLLGEAIDNKLSISGTELMLDLIGSNGFVPLASGLLRKSALELVGGFDEGLIEDVRLQIKLADAGFHFVSVPLVKPAFFYRHVDTSLSHSAPTHFWSGVTRNVLLVHDRLVARKKIAEGLPAIAKALACATVALSNQSMSDAQAVIDEASSRKINLIAGFPARNARVARLIGLRGMLRVTKIYRWLRRFAGT